MLGWDAWHAVYAATDWSPGQTWERRNQVAFGCGKKKWSEMIPSPISKTRDNPIFYLLKGNRMIRLSCLVEGQQNWNHTLTYRAHLSVFSILFFSPFFP